MADGGSGYLDFGEELVVDLFAGGGGASVGMTRGYRAPDIAINHNAIAIAVHRANHPEANHYIADVYEVDPLVATGGRPVGILWASPDCRHHSKAKGGKPRSRKVRGLAWVVIKWAAVVRPRLVFLENVEEFCDWGPLDDAGKPIKAERGRTFRAFVAALSTGLAADHPDMPEILSELGVEFPVARLVRGLGYTVEWKEIRAYTQGARTIRKRMYMVARCDGHPIIWPEDRYGDPADSRVASGERATWRTAAECIDFALPCPSIFERKRPLKPNTERRLAKGLQRYLLECPEPFIVPMRGTSAAHHSTHVVGAPLSTITGGGTHHALVAAHLAKFRFDSAGSALDRPAPTVTAGGDMARPAGAAHALGVVTAQLTSRTFAQSRRPLVTAHVIKYYKTGGQWSSCNDPIHTLPTKGRMAVVQALIVPADLLTEAEWARAAQVAALLRRHLPDLVPEGSPTVDAVMVGDEVITDVGLRMLVPPELARAQGFPDDYILDRGWFVDEATGVGEWRKVTKTDQVRLIGNSVCPDVAEALVRSNVAPLRALYERMAA